MWLKRLLNVNMRLSCHFLIYLFSLDSAFHRMLSAGWFSLISRREETLIRKMLVWLNALSWSLSSWHFCASDSCWILFLFFSHFSISKQMENQAWLSLFFCCRWLDLVEQWLLKHLKYRSSLIWTDLKGESNKTCQEHLQVLFHPKSNGKHILHKENGPRFRYFL